MRSALTVIRWRARASSLLRARFVLFIDSQSSLAVPDWCFVSVFRANLVTVNNHAFFLNALQVSRLRLFMSALKTTTLTGLCVHLPHGFLVLAFHANPSNICKHVFFLTASHANLENIDNHKLFVHLPELCLFLAFHATATPSP